MRQSIIPNLRINLKLGVFASLVHQQLDNCNQVPSSLNQQLRQINDSRFQLISNGVNKLIPPTILLLKPISVQITAIYAKHGYHNHDCKINT